MVRILDQDPRNPNDTLNLGDDTQGPDTVFGLTGRDTLTTDAARPGSVLFGNKGNDSLTSAAQSETLYGGAENDTLKSRGGLGVFFGDLGDDYFESRGTVGGDTVYGGNFVDIDLGTDIFNFGNGLGTNFALGNKGQDFLSGSGFGADTLYGGQDDDTLQVIELSFSGGTGTSGNAFIPNDTPLVTVITGQNSGGTGGTGVDVDVIQDDTVLAPNNPGRNYLSGDKGKDLVVGLGDRDTLLGGTETDTLILLGDITGSSDDSAQDTLQLVTRSINLNDLRGVPQNGYLDAGDGDDSLIAFGGLRGRETMLGGGGNDTLRNIGVRSLLLGNTGNDTLESTVFGRSTLYGGVGDDSILVDQGGNQVYGDKNNDTIVSNTVANSTIGDTLYGDQTADADAGADSLFGGVLQFGYKGRDTLQSSYNSATLYGGAGDDSLIGTGGVNPFLSGETENDTLVATTANSTLDGGANNDSLYAVNGQGNTSLWGGAGDDILVAGSSTDTVRGADGNDFLVGSSGGDTLDAREAGSDTLEGFLGADTLIGTAGSFDGFYYGGAYEGFDTATGAIDRITSFDTGTDKFYFSGKNFPGFGDVNPRIDLNREFYRTDPGQPYGGTVPSGVPFNVNESSFVFEANSGGGGTLYYDFAPTAPRVAGTTNGGEIAIAIIDTGLVNSGDIVIF